MDDKGNKYIADVAKLGGGPPVIEFVGGPDVVATVGAPVTAEMVR